MGRHSGGSRSGGSRGGGRSRGGSRGSGVRTSKTPFRGCYNRSFYDRKGRYHQYYTSSRTFGTSTGWNPGIIFALIFVTLHMCLMIGSFSGDFIHIGKTIDGDRDRIYIVDNAEALSESEETKVMEILYEVYQKSGMPVTVYTDDFTWREHYSDIEVYSEELYYRIGFDESAMVLLYTTNNSDEFYDYEYDFYCGDDTEACLSDKSLNTLGDNFYKGMSGLNLCNAIEYSFGSIMDELATTGINWAQAPTIVMLLAFYSIFYFSILKGVLKSNSAYKYFQEHPEKLSYTPMTLYDTCPNCGASNSEQLEVCPYCNSLLKVSDGKVQFVSPDTM